MNRVKVALEYSKKYLEIDRPSPLSDKKIEFLIQNVLSGGIDKDISDVVYDNFKIECERWIFNSKLNKLHGLETFPRKDIIIGCTHFIDNLYMQGPVQTINGDYKYHQRLGKSFFKDVGSLIPGTPLIIAMPFPQIGAPHLDMQEILDEAKLKKIDVHIDGAWITCCKDINFDFNHPAIKSVGVSLSKGLGLGWNRIGLRWTKNTDTDAIKIMNDFSMNNRALVMIGLHFIRNLEPDYLWKTYEKNYYKVCNDFDLVPTKSIYLALQNNNPVGISPLIRYLNEK